MVQVFPVSADQASLPSEVPANTLFLSVARLVTWRESSETAKVDTNENIRIITVNAYGGNFKTVFIDALLCPFKQ
jgi:hypothetical protein